jgi:hypothetical protein
MGTRTPRPREGRALRVPNILPLRVWRRCAYRGKHRSLGASRDPRRVVLRQAGDMGTRTPRPSGRDELCESPISSPCACGDAARIVGSTGARGFPRSPSGDVAPCGGIWGLGHLVPPILLVSLVTWVRARGGDSVRPATPSRLRWRRVRRRQDSPAGNTTWPNSSRHSAVDDQRSPSARPGVLPATASDGRLPTASRPANARTAARESAGERRRSEGDRASECSVPLPIPSPSATHAPECLWTLVG